MVAAVVAKKTTEATAVVGAQTRKINNQLKVAPATAMKTTMVTGTTTTTITTMAMMVAVMVGGSGGGPCRSRKLGGGGKTWQRGGLSGRGSGHKKAM